jgi:hypothetical protein
MNKVRAIPTWEWASVILSHSSHVSAGEFARGAELTIFRPPEKIGCR